MNVTRNRATGKQIAQWALDAIPAGAILWAGVLLIDTAGPKLYRDPAEGWTGLMTGLVLFSSAIFYVVARIETRRLRPPSDESPAAPK